MFAIPYKQYFIGQMANRTLFYLRVSISEI